jgi:TctA family transporter
LAISQGDITTLWDTPFSAIVLGICALLLIVPAAAKAYVRYRVRPTTLEGDHHLVDSQEKK